MRRLPPRPQTEALLGVLDHRDDLEGLQVQKQDPDACLAELDQRQHRRPLLALPARTPSRPRAVPATPIPTLAHATATEAGAAGHPRSPPRQTDQREHPRHLRSAAAGSGTAVDTPDSPATDLIPHPRRGLEQRATRTQPPGQPPRSIPTLDLRGRALLVQRVVTATPRPTPRHTRARSAPRARDCRTAQGVAHAPEQRRGSPIQQQAPTTTTPARVRYVSLLSHQPRR